MANLIYKRVSTGPQSTARQHLVLDEAQIEDPVTFEEQARHLQPPPPTPTVRRGRGYTLRVSAVPAVHRQLLAHCQPLDGTQGIPAIPVQRKARREYENRVNALPATTVGP